MGAGRSVDPEERGGPDGDAGAQVDTARDTRPRGPPRGVAHPLAAFFRRRARERDAAADADADEGAGGRFRRAVEAELAYGRGLVWAVVAFVFGIALYFALPAEPSPIALTLLAAVLWAAALRRRRAGLASALALGAAMLATGAACASLRTALVSAPVLQHARSAEVAGFVEAVEGRDSGYRLRLSVVEIDRLPAALTPVRVRLAVRGHDPAPRVGEAVRVRARLMPPPRAVMPGGYDFSMRAFFDRLGATGFAFGAPEPADLGPPPVSLAMLAAIAQLRGAIAQRVFDSLGSGAAGGLAVALIVGDRTAIPDEVTEALRTAGLAHILAISGLHMALFSGAVFLVLRAGLALSPRLALAHRIDLWAAGGALAAATFYLAISGGAIATQRAYVMIALMLVARLLGRRALSLRNVALAALLILLVTPEALREPGFQMSFAAVVALIASYEELLRRKAARPPKERVEHGIAVRGVLFSGKWLGGILLTSLIAGAATGIIGAHHFHRIAPLGPLINLIAMPVVSLAIMPMAVLALALMPFGLETAPLTLMGAALDRVVAVSHWAHAQTPSGGVLGAPSQLATLLAVVAAGGLLCLAPRGYRRLCVVPLGLAAAAQGLHVRPDVLISDSGRVVAVRDETGALTVSGRPGSFLSEMWLRADGVDGESLRDRGMSARTRRCDDTACVILAYPSDGAGQIPGGGDGGRAGDTADGGADDDTPPHARRPRETVRPLVISLVREASAFAEDCRRADIIVSELRAPANCAARAVFDATRLARTGTVALYLGPPEPAAETLRAGGSDIGASHPSFPSNEADTLRARQPERPGAEIAPPGERIGLSPAVRDEGILMTVAETQPETPKGELADGEPPDGEVPERGGAARKLVERKPDEGDAALERRNATEVAVGANAGTAHASRAPPVSDPPPTTEERAPAPGVPTIRVRPSYDGWRPWRSVPRTEFR